MVAYAGTDPLTATLKDSETLVGVGVVLTNDSTNNKLKLGVATSFAIGISAGEGERDADGALVTSAPKCSFFPIGGVHMVAALAETYTTGKILYLKGAGRVGGTAGSDKIVGVYCGPGEVVATAGDLIPVNTNSSAIA